ncbi:hypothetical protein KUTeg_016351 [Tegillarca granosa]|uniref:Ribosomal protein S15 n=1 Tax=Tegillarca granosa TaxID=220873 RepID=A0ABQ9EN48_TEGGR|nr:hypothetical protein KUTeg_016351 [Tegillarca granosa]
MIRDQNQTILQKIQMLRDLYQLQRNFPEKTKLLARHTLTRILCNRHFLKLNIRQNFTLKKKDIIY